jgi:flavin-dependent dehydrogenase
MKKFDVVIIGAGLAGLQCAKLLSRQGAKILLVDRKADLTKGIHTTGIFVRKTLEDFDFPPATLGKPVRNVTLYSPKLKALNLESEKDEFRVGKMGELYKSFLNGCIQNGVEFARATRYVSARVEIAGVNEQSNQQTETIVNLEKNGESFAVKAKVLVGADGAQSRVARDLELDKNNEWIVGYEEVWKNVPLDGEPRLHCFLDAHIAPGYLAWITNDGEETHIGVGGYAEKFNPREALKEFSQKIAPGFVDLQTAELVETRGGRIPVGGVLRKIANCRGLLVGDAAGAVSPLTAGGLDPCLRLSAMAANVILERLESDNPKVLMNYSGELFRSRFVSRLWMRQIIKTFSNQTFLELGFALLRGSIGKKFAKHVFFSRGSFPDIQKLKRPVEVIHQQS